MQIYFEKLVLRFFISGFYIGMNDPNNTKVIPNSDKPRYLNFL